MGFIKLKRPLDARLPGSATAGQSSAGVPSIKAGRIQLGYQDFQIVGSASSQLATIGPRGMWLLKADTSAGSTCIPKIIYLNSPISSGDVCEVYADFNGCTSNGVCLRPYATAVTMGGTTALDSVTFWNTGYGVKLVAVSTLAWAVYGASTAAAVSTGPYGLPVLQVSTS